MNHVTAKLATDLKKAGFPQPAPQPYQMWYLFDNLHIVDFTRSSEIQFHCIVSRASDVSLADYQVGEMATFAPTLEDIAPLLPECVFETWDGSPSCKYMNDEQPRRAFGATFAEAAAKMWLNLKKEYEADFDWIIALNKQAK